MAITFDLPEDIERMLYREMGDISRVAKEALLMEAYRTAKLSLGELAQILGMGVIETLDWLGQHGVPLNYSLEDLDTDRKTLEEIFPQSRA